MESILNFITKFNNVVKNHIEETKECIGKEIVDSSATKAGICVDKIKMAYGAKFSLLGHNYKPEEVKQLQAFNEDVIVGQSNNGAFFVPVSDIDAFGESVILVRSNLNQVEAGNLGRKREEVFRKFYSTKESIKKILPKVETGAKRKQKRKSPLHIFH